VSVTSGSLAVLASAFDSLLDLLSGVILALVAYAMGKRDPFQYPQGKTRMEPLGLIVLASLMAMVSINVIVEAIRRLAAMGTPTVLTLLDIVLLCAVVATKAFLYIYCRTIRSPSVAALAQDHRFNAAPRPNPTHTTHCLISPQKRCPDQHLWGYLSVAGYLGVVARPSRSYAV